MDLTSLRKLSLCTPFIVTGYQPDQLAGFFVNVKRSVRIKRIIEDMLAEYGVLSYQIGVRGTIFPNISGWKYWQKIFF